MQAKRFRCVLRHELFCPGPASASNILHRSRLGLKQSACTLSLLDLVISASASVSVSWNCLTYITDTWCRFEWFWLLGVPIITEQSSVNRSCIYNHNHAYTRPTMRSDSLLIGACFVMTYGTYENKKPVHDKLNYIAMKIDQRVAKCFKSECFRLTHSTCRLVWHVSKLSYSSQSYNNYMSP